MDGFYAYRSQQVIDRKRNPNTGCEFKIKGFDIDSA
jgi:hypothetical protein